MLITTLGQAREEVEYALVRRRDALAADAAERARAQILLDRQIREDPSSLRHLHDASANDRGRTHCA